ncbi:unnamed protein product, partial [Brassica rapa subsp. trilocularis]
IASECARSGSDLKFETCRQLRCVAAVSALLPRRLAPVGLRYWFVFKASPLSL